MKKYPYIFATILATLLAIVVWLITPKEYTAITKVSDEYKETDLVIGLDMFKSHIRKLMNNANTGINDMATYSKVLRTDNFLHDIANKQIAGKHITYGEYLGKADTVEAVLQHINYNFSNKKQILTISFTDHDPLIAAQMLDSVTTLLQTIVTEHRHQVAQAALQNASEELKRAKEEYKQAQYIYSDYVDSHADPITETEMQMEATLKEDVTLAYNHLEEVTNEYTRQKALLQRSYLSFAVVQNNRVPLESNGTFMGYLLSFLTIALALTCIVKKYRNDQFRHTLDWGDRFAPWSITLLVWTVLLGLYYLLDTELYPITDQFYYCLLIWLIVFCICSLTAYHIMPDVKQETISTSIFHINKTIFNIFFAITLLITPLYLYRVLNIVMMFSAEDLMTNLRTLALYGEGQGILNYSSVINQSLFVVALWGQPRIAKWKVAVLAIACILNGLAIMEKGTIFFVAICFIFILFERRIIRTKTIIISGLCLIFIFYIFNLARAGEDSEYQKEETLLGFFAMYVLSPPVAFCQILREVTPQFGTNTFGTIYLFIDRLGFDNVVVKDKLQEFVFVPINTNVYTIFQPFYIDFGYKGIALFAGIYGSVCGWLYRQYKTGSSTACCLYTYAVYVLILQFYQENVFLSMVFVLQFTFFITLFTQQSFRVSFCTKGT